jgi:hypothetical protein
MKIISERALAFMAKIAPAPQKSPKPAGNASAEWALASMAVCAG